MQPLRNLIAQPPHADVLHMRDIRQGEIQMRKQKLRTVRKRTVAIDKHQLLILRAPLNIASSN